MLFKKNRVSYGRKSAIAEEELLNLDKRIKQKTSMLLQRKRKMNYRNEVDNDADSYNKGKPYADFNLFKKISFEGNSNNNHNSNNHSNEIKEIENNKLTKNHTYPWLREETRSYNGIMLLHYEIYDFYNFMKPTKEEEASVSLTFSYIKSIIINEYPQWKVKLFGSNATHLNLPESDLDIVIIPNESYINNEEAVLVNIKNVLFQDHKFNHLQIINARVPIIKGQFKETHIDVDISFGRKNGYAANKIIANIIKDYPWFPPIICVLKYYLRQSKLNSTYTGGISSFCLFTLVYSFVLYMKKNNQISNETTLGDILIQFLNFYGYKFNYEKVGISIRYGGFFYKKEESIINDSNGRGDNGLLSIENFQDINQDIGKNSFKYDQVIQTFQFARDALYKPKRNENDNCIQSYLGQFIYIDKLILQRSNNKTI